MFASDAYLQAATLFAAGQAAECRRLLQPLLTAEPERVDVLHLTALAALQEGQPSEAQGHFQRLLALQAGDAAACCQIGALAEAGGLGDLAETAYRQASAAHPDYLEANYRLALLWRRSGRHEAAETAFRGIISRAPAFADAYLQLGMLLQDAGRWEEAETTLCQAQALGAAAAETHYYLGLCLARGGRWEAAEAEYQRALELKPGLLDGLAALAGELKASARPAEAEAIYRQLLLLRPELAEAYNNLALLLMEQGRPAEAEGLLQHALYYRPAFAEAMHNLSCLLKAQGRLDEAAVWCARALEQQPDYAAAVNHRGIMALNDGRNDEAASDFNLAERLAPEAMDPVWNNGIVKLLQGDFAAGWDGYEYRWQAALKAHRRDFTQPAWEGQPFAGQTLLVYCEQGCGDSIQFVRYLPAVAALGGTLLLECPPELSRLFSGLSSLVRIVPAGEELPSFDLHCPLLSLPKLLGTRLETIPAEIPYLSVPEAARSAMPVLAARPEAPLKVGLVWAGNPVHHNDPNRSLDFALLAPLFKVPNITWVILQKDRRPDHFSILAARRGWLDPLAEGAVQDFADTAALVEQLDLLIGVDTALAHLAGALGKPVWVMLPANPDWRWLTERDDSPWYSSMRLFRQPRRQAGPDVVERVEAELAVWAGAVATPALPPTLQADAFLPPAEAPAPPPRTIQQFAAYQRLVQAKHGVFLYNANDVYVGRALECYGEYGEHETALLCRLLRPGDAVVEVGANIGAITVPLAKAVGPAGKVLAFEPQPMVFHTLCANLALNALENACAYPYALGIHQGYTGMPRMDYAVANNFGGVSLPAGDALTQGGYLPVPSVRLDEVCLDMAPRLLKIDVEGMECEVLQGAERLIRRSRPLLYAENDRLDRSAELIRLLRRLDYRLYWHTPPLFNPDNYFRYPGNHYGSTVSVNLLGIPAESRMEVSGLKAVGAEYEHPLKP